MNENEKHLHQGLQEAINRLPENLRAELSDGYHSFAELYRFRTLYCAALFNEWGIQTTTNPKWASAPIGADEPPLLALYDAHKSFKHHDGELCFGGGWFIVVAMLPTGQISNHYKAEDWELFRIPSAPKAKYEFDGHTAADVLQRLEDLKKYQRFEL